MVGLELRWGWTYWELMEFGLLPELVIMVPLAGGEGVV